MSIGSIAGAAALNSGRRKTTRLLGDPMFSVLAEWLHSCQVGRGQAALNAGKLGPAAGSVGSMLCSHAFGFSIKQLTESTLAYLSSSFRAVDAGDPHHSCRSPHSYAHTHLHRTVPKYSYRHILARDMRTCTNLWLSVVNSCTQTHTHTLPVAESNLARQYSLWSQLIASKPRPWSCARVSDALWARMCLCH